MLKIGERDKQRGVVMRKFMSVLIVSLFCNVVYAQELDGDFGIPNDYFETMRSREQIHASIYVDIIPSFPESLDWRDHGVVTPAKSQGPLGSCWAFAAVGVIESRWALLGHKLTRFSEQQLVNCSHWTMRHYMTALRFYESHNPMPEQCAPYKAYQYSCDSLACPPKKFLIDEYYTVNSQRISDVKASLYVDGPAYLGYRTFDDFNVFWENANPGEVYVNKKESIRTGGHAVLLIGWSDEKRAWLCKNSWGEFGPEGDGTFWLSWDGHYNSLNIGIASVTSYGSAIEEETFSCATMKVSGKKRRTKSLHRVAWELFSK